MPCFEFSNAHEAYPHLLQDVLEFGTDHASRGGDVREISNVMITFMDTVKTHTPLREGSDPLLGLLGGAQLLSAETADGLMTDLFPKHEEHIEALGRNVKVLSKTDQVAWLFEKLKMDVTTRRAMLNFWDGSIEIRDQLAPCVIAITFGIRDNQLNMSVKMRSNDLWNFVPHDLVQFSLLQQTYATALGVSCGMYTHVVDSLHIYHRDIDAAEFALAKMRHPAGQDLAAPIPVLPLSQAGWDYENIQLEAWSSFVAGQKVVTAAGEHIKSRISARLTELDESEV